MSDNTIASFLKQLRKTSGYSVAQVIDKLKPYNIDISSKTLYGYESGLSMLNADVFVALCKIYKCENPMDIFATPSFNSNEISIIEKYRALDEHGKESVNITLERETYRVDEKNRLTSSEVGNGSSTRLINYYYRLASAGTGQILFDMPPTKRIEIPDTPEYQKADYAIGVNGDSMEPTYKDGDTLLVEMAEDVDLNDIGIFLVNEECFVKKLGADELVSLNENYPNIPLNESAKCMGKVIGKL